MKNTSRFIERMIRVENNFFAFVPTEITDKDGNPVKGCFLLDTGSNGDCLFATAKEFLSPSDKNPEKPETLRNLGDDLVSDKHYSFSFNIGSRSFKETFVFIEQFSFYNVGGLPVFGLLGIGFMKKQRLSLDFNHYVLFETQEVDYEEIDADEFSYIFSIDQGLSTFGLPTIYMQGDEGYHVLLLDSGSDNNILTENLVNTGNVPCRLTDGLDLVNGLNGSEPMSVANVDFSLIGLTNGDEGKFIKHSAVVRLTKREYLAKINTGNKEYDEQIKPIIGLIGCPFISKQGWTIDFVNDLVYKKKAS